MASCPQELERHGPTCGMSFTREKAEELFQHYLNKKISWFETGIHGLNNLLFFIQCENDKDKYVLKICGKFWNKSKTECEVTAIDLVRKYTNIPVPKVLAYSSNKNNEFGIEWIAMTRIKGEPLRRSSKIDDTWPKLTIDQQKSIINELVEYVSELHKKMPHSNKIGNYQMNGEIGADSDGMGPWNNYKGLFNDRLSRQIYTLYAESIFDPIRDDIMRSINEFQQLDIPEFNDVPNVYTHNDLGVQNILVLEDNKIQGIVDWEWAGSYPISEEYFRSYKPIVYDHQLKNYLYDELEKHNILTPRTIPHFSFLQKITDFIQSIVPWYLTNLANPEHPTVQKELFQARDRVNMLLQQIKEELK